MTLKTAVLAAALFLAGSIQAREVLKICTDNTQMTFLVSDEGPVYFQYWGEKIENDGFSLRYHGRTEFLVGKMKGLDPKKNYRVEEINVWKSPRSRGKGGRSSAENI